MGGLPHIYDMVFTTYDKNFYVDHIAAAGNTICGFSSSAKTDAELCEQHILSVLKLDGHKNASVKIFKDMKKYTERLAQMQSLEAEDAKSDELLASILSVTL